MQYDTTIHQSFNDKDISNTRYCTVFNHEKKPCIDSFKVPDKKM